MANVRLVRQRDIAKAASSPYHKNAYAAGMENDPKALYLVQELKRNIKFRLPYFFGI